MASKAGGKGGLAKIPKKMKRELEPDDDDDDFLEDLVVDSDPKPPTYSTLKTGGFVTKAEDRKRRLEKRRAKIDAKDDDNDDDDDETEKEQLERETRELESKLRKTERAAEKARDKEEITPSLVENQMSRGRRGETNSGSSVADCVHTAIFQNIRENCVL